MESVLFACDSRGRGLDIFLRNSLCSNFRVLTYSGAGIYDAVHRAANTIKYEKWSQIYLLAGICSITIKDRVSKIVSLREENPVTSMCHLKLEVTHSLDFVSLLTGEHNVKCVMAPITGIDLRTYNKGLTISRVNSIDAQQVILNDLITEFNKYIVSVNKANNVVTPWVSRFVHKRTRDNMSHLYHNLAGDGCHLTDDLRGLWADALSTAVIGNAR